MDERDFDGMDEEKTVRVEEHGGKVQVIVKGRMYMSWDERELSN